MPICVDKYKAREFVKSKGLSSILNELYGIYDNPEDIDFAILPEQFVIKTTDGTGGENIFICKNKKTLDIFDLIGKLKKWKNKKDVNAGREWAYTEIKESKYIIEKYLENEDMPEAGIFDYKFFCFDGEPKCIGVDKNRYIGHKRNFYDIHWMKLNITINNYPPMEEEMVIPPNFVEMLRITRLLAADFPFVRVDLYNLNGEIIFGELTFYPSSGYAKFTPDKFDFELGSYFNITQN
jgi:hypothetical protein